MRAIATYLFFDLETTGLVEHTKGAVHITELGMLAVKRKNLLNMGSNEDPRVQYKLNMCFNPPSSINKQSAMLSGLTNHDLKNEAEFNKDTFKIIKTFINSLEKPVCLVAHNGFKFHFPILKYHFERMKVELSDDIMCTDSLYAFYDILEPETQGESYLSLIDHDPFDVFGINKIYKLKTFSQLKRQRFFYDTYPENSYKLKDIYSRVVEGPHLQPNWAEHQCIMMMKTALARVEEFVEWVEEYHCAFSEIPTMNM